MQKILAPLPLLLALTGCEQSQEMAPNQVSASNEIPATEAQANADQTMEPGEIGSLPDDHNLIEGSIDPESIQGAGQVLQGYAALLEQGRLAEARQLWTEGGAGSGLSEENFEEVIGRYSEIHAEVGAPGRIEGAAGSAYIEIPLRFYGKLRSGRPFNSAGTATLRRVNDVPGSTEEQRRWHIYRIDVQPPL